MQLLLKYFFAGLLAFLPIFLTVYAVWLFAAWLDRISAGFIGRLAPGLPDVPGLGIALGVVLIMALGMLVTSRVTRWMYRLVETPLRALPIVKDVYSAVRQLISLLAPNEEDDTGQVVAVRHPDFAVTLVGLMTRSSFEDLDAALGDADTVAVYLPMSYQIGGYTVFIPRAWVTPLDMAVETAMSNAMTGWVRGGGP